MIRFRPLICIVLLLACFGADAKQGEQFIRCSSTEYQESLMEDPIYRTKWEKRQEKLDDYMATYEKGPCTGTTYIPVAVHYSGGTSASMACLQNLAQSQVDVLNEDYNATNADISNWPAVASAFPGVELGESCIQFCLATQNHPSGSGLANGDPAVTLGLFSGDSGWSGYINIFVRNIGPLGYSPLGGSGNGDGVTVDNNAFGLSGFNCNNFVPTPPINLGRTLTHELGHFLDLNHTFVGCGTGDGIADTPPQSQEYYGCQSLGASTTTCSSQDMFMNFMDYADDGCMYMFTDGQADRMLAYATSNLQTVINNAAIVCNSDIPPVASFSSDATEICLDADNNIQFTDGSANTPTSWTWTFEGGSPASSNSQNPLVTYSSSGTFNVSLQVCNAFGCDTQNSTNYITTASGAACPSDCGTTFVDSGGNGQYGNNENEIWTFCPNPITGQVIEAEFTSFDVEENQNNTSCWDELYIYDGNSTSASQIGVYCNNTGSPGTITSTSSDGCLTFNFISDDTVTNDGWAANITCISLAPPSCTDGILNQDEIGVDCGGSTCNPCPTLGCTDANSYNFDPAAQADDGSCLNCSDGTQNGDETGVDCGGSLTGCPACPVCVDFNGGPYVDLDAVMPNGIAPADPNCGISYDTGDIPNNVYDGPFEVWSSEAYLVDGLVAGTSYTVDVCSGPNAGSWPPEIVAVAPSGAQDGVSTSSAPDCSLTFVASENGDYIFVVNEQGTCGGNENFIDNGYFNIECTTTEPNPLDLTVFLEGCYFGTSMSTGINSLIPLNSPYDVSPWNAPSNTSPVIPGNAVDWILVELLDPSTFAVVEQQTCILRANGSVISVNGEPGVNFSTTSGTYRVAVRHRNHLPILSRPNVTLPGSLDLSDAQNVQDGANQLSLQGSGDYAMLSGDISGEGIISVNDFNLYMADQNGSSINVYAPGDMNMDGNVSVSDFFFYLTNSSKLAVPQIRD